MSDFSERLQAMISSLNGFFSDPGKVLKLSLGVCFFMTALHALFCTDIFTDVAAYYAEIPRQMCRIPWSDALLPAMSPLQPFLAGSLCFFLKIEPFTAAILVSGFFYIATVLPLYFMLKAFVEPKHAAWGCLLYAAAPKIIRFGCGGLLDSGRNFFIVSIIALLLADWSERRWLKALIFGCCCGLLVMSRGEGALFLPLCFAFLALAAWRFGSSGAWTSKALGSFLVLVLAGVAMFATLSPRLVQVGLKTGYPVPDSRLLNDLRDRAPFLAFGAPEVPMKPPRMLDAVQASKESSAPAAKESSGGKLLSLVQDSLRGSYELYFALALLGLFFAVKERRWKAFFWIPLAFLLFNEAVFAAIALAYRYFIINIMLLMPFTVMGLCKVLDWLEGFKLKGLVAAALATILVLQLANGAAMALPSSKNAHEKAIGDWIKARKAELKSPSASNVVILTSNPPYVFWADADYIYLRKDAKAVPARADFDVAVLESKQKAFVEQMRARADFEEAGSWANGKVLLFKKKRSANP